MKRTWVILVVAMLVIPALADAGDWIGRLRVIGVNPNDDSGTIGDTGTGVSVDNAWTGEVDLTYMFSETWGVEVIAATTTHDLATTGGAIGGLNAGEVKVLPPTITIQYHFPSESAAHFYAGLGINYTLFYSYDLSGDLAAAGVSDVDLDNSFGFAGDIGVDIDINEKWLVNFDVKYIQIDTDAELQLAGGGVLDTINVDVNPWVYGIGIGLRF